MGPQFWWNWPSLSITGIHRHRHFLYEHVQHSPGWTCGMTWSGELDIDHLWVSPLHIQWRTLRHNCNMGRCNIEDFILTMTIDQPLFGKSIVYWWQLLLAYAFASVFSSVRYSLFPSFKDTFSGNTTYLCRHILVILINHNSIHIHWKLNNMMIHLLNIMSFYIFEEQFHAFWDTLSIKRICSNIVVLNILCL